MDNPVCSKCGRDILLQDEACSFTAHKDSGAVWFHGRCNYPKHGGWAPPERRNLIREAVYAQLEEDACK